MHPLIMIKGRVDVFKHFYRRQSALIDVMMLHISIPRHAAILLGMPSIHIISLTGFTLFGFK